MFWEACRAQSQILLGPLRTRKSLRDRCPQRVHRCVDQTSNHRSEVAYAYNAGQRIFNFLFLNVGILTLDIPG